MCFKKFSTKCPPAKCFCDPWLSRASVDGACGCQVSLLGQELTPGLARYSTCCEFVPFS